jgi:hypothetical protein
MDSISKRLLDKQYIPDLNKIDSAPVISKNLPCPVTFTNDPIEFIEGDKFLQSKLRPLQRQFILDLYSNDEKGNYKYDTGVYIAGMRGGKSMLAAYVAAFQLQMMLGMDSPAEHFHQQKGQRITIQFIASSEAQAKETAYAAFDGLVAETYWFEKYIWWLQQREAVEGSGIGSLFERLSSKIEFGEKRVAILSLHSNSAALAGKTSACCIFDELSRFDVSEGTTQGKTEKRSAQAVYNTVARSAASLAPFSKVLTITSPMYEDDYGMRLLYSCGTFKGGTDEGSDIVRALVNVYPTKVKGMLGYHSSTFELNPKYDARGNVIMGGLGPDDAFFQSQKAQDPESFRRDFYAVPPSTISPFFEYPERIIKCAQDRKDPPVLFETIEFTETVNKNGISDSRNYVGKKIYVPKADFLRRYVISCDQGEKKDAFVVAMGHAEPIEYETTDASGNEQNMQRYKVVIDFIEGWVPDRQKRLVVSFPNVDDVIAQLHRNFNIYKVLYDHWNSTESVQRLFSLGLVTERTKQTDNLMRYEVLKTLVYGGLIEFPNNDRLVKELRQLNIIKGKKVDFSDGAGHNDFSDAISRVAFEVFNLVMQETVQGDFMGPLKQFFPSMKSLVGVEEMMMTSNQPGTNIFGPASNSLFSKGNQGLFGQGAQVQQNIFPNFKLK